jgi:hypothetical protein
VSECVSFRRLTSDAVYRDDPLLRAFFRCVAHDRPQHPWIFRYEYQIIKPYWVAWKSMVQPRNERSASSDSEVRVTSFSSDLHNYDQPIRIRCHLEVRCARVSVVAHSPAVSVISSSLRTKGGRISKTFSMTDRRSKQLQNYLLDTMRPAISSRH